MVHGCTLAMLEHTGPRRMRVGWEIEETHLEVTVRDDDALFPDGMAEYRLRETLTALGGDFAVDAVPGWGTTVVARFPLTPGTDTCPGRAS
jgi:signal transduction histidine kinase